MRVDLFIFNWLFSQLLFFSKTSGETVHNTLKCYQCEIEGTDPNHTCKADELKICPNDYAADRCLTNIKRNVTGHYLITKRCALAPCELPGIQSSLLKLSASCDQSREEFNCYTCCNHDGCNLHSSASGAIFQKSTLLQFSLFWPIIEFLVFSLLCFPFQSQIFQFTRS